MAYEEKIQQITLEADGDQSANQYKFMVLGADGVALNTTAGGACVGVLQNKPTDTQSAIIAVGGVAKVEAGDAVARGVDVQSNATGLAITAAAADFSQGTALAAAAAAGDIIPVLLRPNAQNNA
jgi:hypothetical protein